MNLSMNNVGLAVQALTRALLGIWHPWMLLLTIAPFAVAGTFWSLLGWWYWDAWIDLCRNLLTQSSLGTGVRWLVALTGVDLSLLLPPLIGMLLLVPLVVATAMLLIALLGMPLIVRHVAQRRYAQLEWRDGGSTLHSTLNGLTVTMLLVLGWIITLPLWLIPVVGAFVPLLLLGWAAQRTFSYDALAAHADAQELAILRRQHRSGLLALGLLMAAFGSVPTLLWIAGALAVLLLPAMALIAVWLYGAVFVLSGLAFTHYCLEALQRHRTQALQSPEQPPTPSSLLTQQAA
jgi:hypothetical protein